MLLKESCSQEKYVKLCVWCSLCNWNKQFGFLGESPGLVLFLPHSKNITLLQTLVSPNCSFFYFAHLVSQRCPGVFPKQKSVEHGWQRQASCGKLRDDGWTRRSSKPSSVTWAVDGLDVEVFWGIPTLSFVLSLHRGCHHSRYFSICRNHFLLVISATWRRPCQYPKRAPWWWWTHLYMIYMASFGSRYFNKFHLIFRLFDLSCIPLVPC